jgi:hypothetical protein
MLDAQVAGDANAFRGAADECEVRTVPIRQQRLSRRVVVALIDDNDAEDAVVSQ